MTLILTCLTNSTVFLLSDRRFTNGRAPYQVLDDESNKCVVVEGRLAFGYTGLGQIHGQPTDDWLAHAIAAGPSHNMSMVAERVRDKATRDFRTLPHPAHLRRHAFMGVGWFRLKGELELIPGIITISNALDHRTGEWLHQPLPQFEISTAFPDKLPGGCHLQSVGIVPDPEEKSAVVRVVRKCVKHRRSTDRTVEFGLLVSMRWLSSRHFQVGPGLMSVCIPKVAVETQEETGELLLLNGPPGGQTPTFSYVSAKGSRTYFGPHFVGGGSIMSGFKIDPL